MFPKMNERCFLFAAAAPMEAFALAESLAQHPEVHLPALHRLSDHKSEAESLADEFRTLLESVPEGEVCGLACPWGDFSKSSLLALKESQPQLKAILLLNPPVTSMRARHHELLGKALENQVDFGQALAMEETRAAGRDLPRRNPDATSLQYRKVAHLSGQVENFFEVFGRERTKVVLAEDWQENPDSLLRELCEFLNLDHNSELVPSQVKEATALRGTHHLDLAVKRLMARLPGGESLRKVFSHSLEKKYRRLADRIFAPMSDQSINSILEEELLEEFEPEVARLSKLLDRDLSHWNEPRFPRSEHDHHDHHH